ncbi:MAG TPA: inorganic phosphate transporter [Urbifossiella sp.]|jgi:phosphate/sulfate permease|nr:inorganic phosphate transporter [Urbifossiella sp.]
MSFWDAATSLPAAALVCLAVALFVAFAFEFINGFHDTANAVTTVIYTRTMKPTPAVIYSGTMNCLGALLTVVVGSAAVAFSIVNLLPVDLLVEGNSNGALVMVMSLLLAGVTWNLGTWAMGLPVSSSHTLIGSILGVGIANGWWSGTGFGGVNWTKAGEVGLGLLISPIVGFACAAGLLLAMKKVAPDPRLYTPPGEGEAPPRWIRAVLVLTCGGVSFAHGSNDGQKGMGLVLLVLVGFLPVHYALDTNSPDEAKGVAAAVAGVREEFARHAATMPAALDGDLAAISTALAGKDSFEQLDSALNNRWAVRQAIFRSRRALGAADLPADLRAAVDPHRKTFAGAIEFVPLWVVFGTALALGVGTCVGYKRVVVTVAEKIGNSHLNYAQGAAAQGVAAATILLADIGHLPVSTTQVLSSGVGGTMVASGSGMQTATCRKILLAWVLTLPACMILAGCLFILGRVAFG